MVEIPKEFLDALMAGYKKPEDITGPEGILRQLTKAVMERALEAEMTEHLGYEKHDPAGRGSGNSRNGTGGKTLKTETGEVAIEVPRDRNGSFEPQLVKKRQTHFSGFDEKIISLYARGMTVREIQGHLQELYGVEVSPDLISRVTDVVIEEVKAWQNRPLDRIYPILYLDALTIKVRDQGTVSNKSAYLAIGVTTEGKKEVLGLWLEQTEGAKFWLKIMTELKSRGVADILVVCCDGLKGFPEAIEAAFPQTTVQTCIVHMIRNSMRFVTWKDQRALVSALKAVYKADTAEAAEAALSEFEKTDLSRRYPMIARSWRQNWERVIPFLSFPVELRKAIYTTNAIESLNFQLRKIIKSRGHFPSEEAAVKLLYLALIRAERRWKNPAHDWKNAYQQLAIQFEGRLTACA